MEKDNQSIFRFSHFAMGTTFEIMISGKDEIYSRQVSQAIFGEIDRIENLFSRFNSCSEIGQINHLKPGQSLKVGVETFECLEAAAQIHSQTHGAFDVNIGSLVKNHPDAGGHTKKPNPGQIQLRSDLSKSTGEFIVQIQEEQSEHASGGVDLDLGAIGKGYALDKTVDILSDWSINRALIHGGTSTALAVGTPPNGHPNKEGWPVGITGDWNFPHAPKEYLLMDRALSGSGTEVKGEHIFDPRTGRPAKGHRAAWVSHPSAAIADALSTAFMVMRTEEVKNYCDSHPEVWALIIVDSKSYKIFDNIKGEAHSS
jgi:thiamine biosynthesis lipoprotein